MTTKEIAEKTGASYFTCYAWASKLNVKKEEGGYNWTDEDLQNFINRESQKNWKPKEEEIEIIKKHLAEGKALTEIAKIIGKSRNSLYKGIVKAGIMTDEKLKKLRLENRNKELALGREKLKKRNK